VSSKVIPNDPPRALFIWKFDGYSIVRRAIGGKNGYATQNSS
jgi:hypothetical protein